MKSAVIFYHKNILNIYQRAWINDCLDSISAQTHKEFDVFELDYGGTHQQYAQNVNPDTVYSFVSEKMENHIEAMNALISKVFDLGYDVVFNVNMDDQYAPKRFEKQLEAIKAGYQLVSSNWHYTTDGKNVVRSFEFDKANIFHELIEKSHNVIAHPVIAMHKSFWSPELSYNNLLGYEDFDLWKRAITDGKKFTILPDFLLTYRIHENQITKKHKQL